MQIKQQMLAQQVQKKIAPVYILIGQDNYLLDESLVTIKSAIKKSCDYDEKIIAIQTPDDWMNLKEEANSYSLFADTVVLNVFFDKKSIDATGKKILTEYLKSINPQCVMIIRAPNVPAKQILWLSAQEQVVITVAYPLNPAAMKNWIAAQLKKNSLNFDRHIPDLIHQYTQGNMLACAQVIEKIALSNAPNSQINAAQAQEHLSDQCDHAHFELIDACLLGQGDKAVQILRHMANNKTEATLILWMLAQEVRVLLQLFHFLQQQLDIKTASNQLKIWPQKINLYQASLNRLNKAVLAQLLHYCHAIDKQIKSNLNTQVWNSLENLALSLCLGKPVGDACIL